MDASWSIQKTIMQLFVFKSEKILPFFPISCFVYPFCLAGSPIIYTALFIFFFFSLFELEISSSPPLDLKINPINYKGIV